MGKSEIIYNYDERNNFLKARTGTGRIWRLVILWDDFSRTGYSSFKILFSR